MPYKALASVGGQIMTGLVNNAIAQHNAEDQRNWQQMMWMAQNKWNDPSHMSDLMRRAGLNPFTMTNAEPAGSAGTGAMAQTFPIESPLVALKTVAEVENLNASTGRIESDTEKLYKEIMMLDLAYERGLIEFDDYKKRLDQYWKAYGEKSEYQLDVETIETSNANTAADTAVKESQKELNESQTALNVANTNTVNALRDHLVEVQKATADSLNASADLAREQCNKTKEEIEKLSDDDAKRTWGVTIGHFFGLADISVLTPELQAKAAQYYWDFQQGKYSYESTISAFQDQVNRYVEKNGHIVQSTSVNHSMGVKIGPISGNASSGKSGTF